MSEPITWRSLAGGNTMPADASTPMRYAGLDMNQGFAALQKALGIVTDTDEANWQNQKANNTALLQDELRLAKTPEQVAALEASGRMAEMRQAMGSQFDRKEVNALEDNRMNVVRDQLTKSQQFTEAQQIEAEKPLARQFEMARLKGDMETMKAIAESNPNALFLPKEMQAAKTQGQQDWRFEREKVDANVKDQLSPYQILQAADNLKNGQVNRDVALRGAATAETNAATGQVNSAAHVLSALMPAGAGKGGSGGSGSGTGGKAGEKSAFEVKMQDSGLDKGTINNAVGIDNLMKGFKELGVDDAQQKDIFNNIRKHFPKGMPIGEDPKGNTIYEPIPVSYLLRAVSQAPEDRVLHMFGSSARGDNTRIMLNKLYAHKIDGQINPDQDKEAIAMLGVAREARANRANPPPSAPSTPNPMEARRMQLLDSVMGNLPGIGGLAQKKTQ